MHGVQLIPAQKQKNEELDNVSKHSTKYNGNIWRVKRAK